MRFLSSFTLMVLCATFALAQELPREWVDPDTGHRVIRLSDEPGSASLYFHQNAYTPDGSKLIITTPTGLSTIDLQTRKIEKVVEGRVNVIVTGRKTGQVYYTKAGVVYATDLNTKTTKEIAKLPPRTSVSSVNPMKHYWRASLTMDRRRPHPFQAQLRKVPAAIAIPERAT